MNTPTSSQRRALMGMGLLGALPLGWAQTAAYPSRAVRMVVPFPPGGPTDVLARIVATKLGERFGQAFAIDNKAGSSGMMGSADVVKAAPDGYTLLGNASIHVINPSLYPKIPFDALTDFTPITQLAHVPLILVVNNDLPVRSVKELIAYAKANPGKLNFASSGNAAAPHLAGESFKLATGIEMQHVPYKGVAPALNDVLGGQLPMLFGSLPSTLQHIKSGKLRPLAVSGASRSPVLPDVPTIGETVPGYSGTLWVGLFAPTGLPAEVQASLQQAMAKTLAARDLRDKLEQQGVELAAPADQPVSPERFAALLQDDLNKWARIVKLSGATID